MEGENPDQGKQPQEEADGRDSHIRAWNRSMAPGSGAHQPEKPAIPDRDNAYHIEARGFQDGSGTEGPGELVRSRRFLEEKLACFWQEGPGDGDAAVGQDVEGWVGKGREGICASAPAR